MDGVIVVLALVTILLGMFGLYYAASGRPTLTNPISRFLFSIRGREPTRAFTALSSGALVALGAYFLLSGLRPSLPLWPALIAFVTFGALQISAHFQQSDV